MHSLQTSDPRRLDSSRLPPAQPSSTLVHQSPGWHLQQLPQHPWIDASHSVLLDGIALSQKLGLEPKEFNIVLVASEDQIDPKPFNQFTDRTTPVSLYKVGSYGSPLQADCGIT